MPEEMDEEMRTGVTDEDIDGNETFYFEKTFKRKRSKLIYSSDGSSEKKPKDKKTKKKI